MELNRVCRAHALASASRAKKIAGIAQGCGYPKVSKEYTKLPLRCFSFSRFANMDFDEEAGPPMLVDIEAAKDHSHEESKSIKVPITIVTGKQDRPSAL